METLCTEVEVLDEEAKDENVAEFVSKTIADNALLSAAEAKEQCAVLQLLDTATSSTEEFESKTKLTERLISRLQGSKKALTTQINNACEMQQL